MLILSALTVAKYNLLSYFLPDTVASLCLNVFIYACISICCKFAILFSVFSLRMFLAFNHAISDSWLLCRCTGHHL